MADFIKFCLNFFINPAVFSNRLLNISNFDSILNLLNKNVNKKSKNNDKRYHLNLKYTRQKTNIFKYLYDYYFKNFNIFYAYLGYNIPTKFKEKKDE